MYAQKPYDLWKQKIVTTANKDQQTFNKKLALAYD